MTIRILKDELPEAYPLSTEFVEKNLKVEFIKHSLAKDNAEHLGQDERKASESLEIQQLEVSLLRGILDNKQLRLELKKQLRMRVAGNRYVPWLTKMVVQAAVINTIDSLVTGADIVIASALTRRDNKYDFTYNGHPVICRLSREKIIQYYYNGTNDLPFPQNAEKLDLVPQNFSSDYGRCKITTGEPPLVILVPFAKTLFTDGENGIKE